MTVTNPYDKATDHENWLKWNVGLEDGSRGDERRGTSDAYNKGWDEGAAVGRDEMQHARYRPVPLVRT